ncbi:hypothetical protein ACB098_06G103000 [Castanea mollissima]|uniref:Uncharacterized protein n=1 Tax=Castanea mollissima TaxID=60419 RepID=A0A8J4RRC1_9ROSI|nr:hypothetical protein CMV_001564 [Castanea mollissima]
MVKAPYYDKNGVKKGAWSPEEDNKLRAYVQRYGHWNWRELPKFAGLSRCGKSCRLRWMNYLRPDVKRGKYTKEEDEKIIKWHQELGNKWSKIAAKLPGRTDNEIKNHWHTHLKKRAKENQVSSEVKEHPSDVSQCETISRNRDSEVESVPANAPSRHILESSPLSPETSSSYFSTLSSHLQAPPPPSGINQVSEDGVASSEAFDEFIGDFWTEPFVADNTFFQNSFPLSLLNRGLISPCASYYDDDIDLFYQVM